MPTFISRTETEKTLVETENTNSSFDEITPKTFANFTQKDFKVLNVSIMWLGSYKIEDDVFPKETCPKCGKEHSLKPYLCEATLFSGVHKILFCCQNCGEQFATNDYRKYFREIANYVAEHRENLPPSDKHEPCTALPMNGRIIWNEETPLQTKD